MRIVVNDIAASTGGAMTVLRDFYSCVCEHDKENEWVFLLGRKYFEETENVKIIEMPEIKRNPIKKLVFDFFSGKRYIDGQKPDVVFSMQNIITFGVKAPQVVYVHQSLPFQRLKKFSFLKAAERSTAIKQRIVGRIIKLSVKKAERVIVQTDWMKEAVCRECSIDEARVTKCRPASAQLPDADSGKCYDSTTFFYPTSKEIYKNNNCLFDASAMLDAKGIKHAVEMTINESMSRGSVKCIGRIPFEQVVEKYQIATLVFPSYIETFGYPLAEARQMGAIVLAADTPFARELLEGYENAFFFPYDQADQLAALMEKVALGEIVRKETMHSVETVESGNCWIPVMRCVLESVNEK